MRVAQNKAYQNAQVNSDMQNAELEYDKALSRVVLSSRSRAIRPTTANEFPTAKKQDVVISSIINDLKK